MPGKDWKGEVSSQVRHPTSQPEHCNFSISTQESVRMEKQYNSTIFVDHCIFLFNHLSMEGNADQFFLICCNS